jgi:hypothetical protein
MLRLVATPREVLEERLHRAIEAARNRLVPGGGIDASINVVSTHGTKRRRKG